MPSAAETDELPSSIRDLNDNIRNDTRSCSKSCNSNARSTVSLDNNWIEKRKIPVTAIYDEIGSWF